MRKLFKRRPWLLPGAALFTLGVIAYVVTLTVYSNQVRHEQQRAEAAQAFMVDLLGSADPFAPADPERGRNITVVEALAIGSKRLETELGDQPEIKAALLGSIAGVYSSLDQTPEAIKLGEEALALNRELYGERSEAVLENLRMLASRYDVAGDYETAGAHYTRQLETARSLYGVDDPRLGVAEVHAGEFIKTQGDIDGGVAMLMDGIDRLRGHEEHAETLIWALTAASTRSGMSDATEALQLLDEALDVAETTYGDNSVYAATVRVNIARDALYLDDMVRSDENYARALQIFEEQLGTAHSQTIAANQNYAVQLNVTGRHAEAEVIFRSVTDSLIEVYGEQHRAVADNYQNLATTITYQGRFDESLPIHRKAYEIYKAELGDHHVVAYPLLSIASIEVERQNAIAAYAAANEALARFQEQVPDSFVEGVAMCLAGLALEQQGDARGTAMVEDSHALILKREALVPKYIKLCRVPVAD